jgi:hypothetical protein
MVLSLLVEDSVTSSSHIYSYESPLGYFTVFDSIPDIYKLGGDTCDVSQYRIQNRLDLSRRFTSISTHI